MDKLCFTIADGFVPSYGYERFLPLLGMLKTLFVCLVWFHYLACVWHAVGETSNTGWTTHYNIGSTLLHRYSMSAHWSIAQLHGTSYLRPHTTAEHVFGVVSLSAAFILFSLVIAKTTHAIIQLSDVEGAAMELTCTRYIKAHGIGSDLSHRARRWIKKQAQATRSVCTAAGGHRDVGFVSPASED